ncbi:MAG TPA: C40 family peptidase [Actinomycetota bacterium]|jgi:peptidoglycan endopeptidase LytE|nr:C40 family peptidase [Actinomycetota bacterium]
MTGSYTGHSTLKYLCAAIVVVAAAALALISEPAQAHSLGDWRKERSHLAQRARSELGTPYSWGGSSPRGFDCSGFTRWTFYGHGADLPHSSSLQFALGKRGHARYVWKRKRLRKGDLVFFSTGGRRIGHVGLYVGDGKFISATSSSGIHVDSVYDPYYWGRRWVRGVRLPATRRF